MNERQSNIYFFQFGFGLQQLLISASLADKCPHYVLLCWMSIFTFDAVSISSIEANKLNTSNGEECGCQDLTAIGLVILSIYTPPYYNSSSYYWMHQSYVKILTQEIKKTTQYTEVMLVSCTTYRKARTALWFASLRLQSSQIINNNNPSCEMSHIQ